MNLIVLLPVLIAIVAGLCLFGKTFWEKRMTVLAIAAGLLFATLLTSSLIGRRHMATERSASFCYELTPFYFADSLMQPQFHQMVKPEYVKYDMTKSEIIPLMKRKYTVEKKYVAKNTYKYTNLYPAQTRMYTLFYYAGSNAKTSDTVVGFLQYNTDTDPKKMQIDYYNLSKVKFAWIGRNDNVTKPMIRKISEDYVDNSTWVVGFTVPSKTSYYVIYLPKEYYDQLPLKIRLTHYFDGYQRTAGRYVLPEKKTEKLASNVGGR